MNRILYLNMADSAPVDRAVVLHFGTSDITITADFKEQLLTVSSSDSEPSIALVDMLPRSGVIEIEGNSLLIDDVIIYEGIGDLQSVDLPSFEPTLINFVEAI